MLLLGSRGEVGIRGQWGEWGPGDVGSPANQGQLLLLAQLHLGSALQMETQLEVKGKNDKELYELEL